MIAQLIKDCGLVHFVYKSDREAAIKALLAEAAALKGVNADEVEEDDLEQDEHKDRGIDASPGAAKAPKQDAEAPAAVPETSSPGESQSNGGAERTVQMLEHPARVLKLAREGRIGAQIPCNNPIMNWLPEHAATPAD